MTRKAKRNVKKDHANQVFPAPLAAVLALVAVLSLSYLWLCGQTDAAGRRIKSLERSRAEVRQRRFNEEYKWHGIKSPQNLERALALHQLEMAWPEKRRAIHISMKGTRFDDRAEYLLSQQRPESKARVAMK